MGDLIFLIKECISLSFIHLVKGDKYLRQDEGKGGVTIRYALTGNKMMAIKNIELNY